MGVVGEGPVGEETEEEGEVGGVAVGWVRRLVGLLSQDGGSDGVVVELLKWWEGMKCGRFDGMQTLVKWGKRGGSQKSPWLSFKGEGPQKEQRRGGGLLYLGEEEVCGKEL